MTSPDGSDERRKGSTGMFVAAKAALFAAARRTPKRATTQAKHVRDKVFGGNTAAMAAAYGVKPRTVNRWMDGTRTPRGEDAERLRRDATTAQTTATGRKRRGRQLAGAGITSGHKATVSRATTFEIRGSDAVRSADVQVELTGDEAAAIAEAADEEEVFEIMADAIARYFNAGSVYGGFTGEDFTFDPDSFHLS